MVTIIATGVESSQTIAAAAYDRDIPFPSPAEIPMRAALRLADDPDETAEEAGAAPETFLRRDHVIRETPPWRPPTWTECGRRLTECDHVITRDTFIARVKRFGQQRAAFTLCMTCWGTAARYQTFDIDPVSVVARDTSDYREKRQTLHNELLALAALVAAHPEEFQAHLDGVTGVTRLSRAGKFTSTPPLR